MYTVNTNSMQQAENTTGSSCQMTIDLFGWQMDDFLPEVADWVGATSFLPAAKDADVTLFI